MSTASLPRPNTLRFGAERLSSTQGWRVEWLLRRNCSLAPRQLMAVYASLCLVSLGIAAVFWAHGATMVMPFAWLELLTLGGALFFYAQHAADRECIALTSECLLVEHQCGWHTERVAFRPQWVRVEPGASARSLIELSGQGRAIAVGRYVRPELRQGLAQEIRLALRQIPSWMG